MRCSSIKEKLNNYQITSGYLLVYFRTGVVLKEIHEGNEIILPEKYQDEDILQLQAFDHEKEYRYIQSALGEVEHLAKDDEQADFYDDVMYLIGDEERKMTVRNYLVYDENDMLKIGDYRIIGISGGGYGYEKQ